MSAATPDPKRRALGKGLDSLLPRVQATAPAEPSIAPVADEGGRARELPIELIDRNPFQTRMVMDEEQLKELAASIAANGVVQPILVRPIAEGRFQLIAGERRWQASKLAGKKTVPAILRQVSDEQALEITIVENLQRADLNPIEQARAFERLGREFKMSQDQIALRTGKDRTTISNFLRMLRLPEVVQARVESGELSFGHAKALLGLNHHPSISRAALRVVANGMSVKQTQEMVQNMLFPKDNGVKGQTPELFVDPNVREVKERLQRALGLKVTIEDKSGRGRVIIEYAQLEDFDTLLQNLAGK